MIFPLIKPSLIIIYLFSSLLFSSSCIKPEPKKNDIESRVNDLLSKMTPDEKIAQMSQIDPGYMSDDQMNKAVRDGNYGSFLNVSGVTKINALQKMAMEQSRLKIPHLICRDVIHG